MPDYSDLAFVDRGEERLYSHSLRHAGDFGYIRAVVRIIAGGVVVRPGGLIDYEQITITHGAAVVGHIFGLALAMPIGGVAVQTAFAHGRGTEALEGGCVLGDVPLEEELSVVEFGNKALGVYGGGFILVATCQHIVGRSELSSRIPFGSLEIADGLSYIIAFPFGLGDIIFGILAGGQKACCKDK